MTRRDLVAGAAGMALAGGAAAATGQEAVALALADAQAAFVIRNLGTGETIRVEPELASQPRSPFSTFKIWNAAIALDTGAIPDLSFRLDWDEQKYPAAPGSPEEWKQAHDVRSAFKASAVWFFREIAIRIGAERMGPALRAIGYGNADISGGIDRFWLNSSLRITAEEQVDRIADLVQGGTPLAPRTVALVQELMEIERGPRDRVFSGKTGAGRVGDGFDGWFVGTLAQGKNRHAFCLFMRAATLDGLKTQRMQLTREALKALGL